MKREFDKFHLMKVFKTIIQEGSFTKAAEILNLKTSSVSKGVSQLEKLLGLSLLYRTTRSLSLTDVGQIYYERTLYILEQIEDLEGEISSHREKPIGKLRITAPVAFGEFFLGPLIPKFMKLYPDLLIDLELTDKQLDISRDGIDVAIRTVEFLEDSSLYSLQLPDANLIVVASPSYLKNHGTPKNPGELQTHNVMLHQGKKLNDRWKFFKDGNHCAVTVKGNYACSNFKNLMDAAKQGIGIVKMPHYIANPSIKSGYLIPILTDYHLKQLKRYVFYHQKRELSPKLNVFLKFLCEALDFKGDPVKGSGLRSCV